MKGRKRQKKATSADRGSQWTTLSSLDGVFLFTFSVFVFISALLNIIVGALGGILPVLTGLIVSYPFYIGVYRGIIEDKVTERLVAWRFLLVFSSLVPATLIVMVGIPVFFEVLLLGEQIARVMAIYRLEAVTWILYGIPFAATLLVGTLMSRSTSAWHKLSEALREAVPKRKRELVDIKLEKALDGHAGFGSLLTSLILFLTYNLSITVIVNLHSAGSMTLPPGYQLLDDLTVQLVFLPFFFILSWIIVTWPPKQMQERNAPEEIEKSCRSLRKGSKVPGS